MNKEFVSTEAEQLYKEHKQADQDVKFERSVVEDATHRIAGLRSGRELTSYGLGGKYAQHQADTIAENIARYDIPRRDEAQARYHANLEAAAAHKDEHFEEYVDMAKANMQAHEVSSTLAAPVAK